MKYFLALFLSLLSAAAANYAPAPVVPDLSSLTNRGGSLINPAVIVLGATNALDGKGGVFIYSVTDTNAIDNIVYFPSLASTGKWIRTSYILSSTPAASPLSLTDGTLSISALTNWFTFSAGTNMEVTITSNSVSYAMTNTTGTGSGTTFVNGTAVTNLNLVDDAFVKISQVGTNAYIYITNYFSWEGIPIGPRPNLKDNTYIYWVPSGTNLNAYIVENGIDLTRMEQMQTGYIVGRAAGTFGNWEYIAIGANLTLTTNGVLSAVVSGATNGTPLSVNGGGVLAEGNLSDNSEIAFANSGSNITATLVANSIATNKLDATFYALLLNNYRINNLTNTFLSITNNAVDTGRVVWYTNSLGDYVAYATNLPAGGGSGLGTNAFVNGVLLQPVYFTNSTEVFWSTNGNGHVVLSINQWDGFYSDLTNAVIASNNIAVAYDTGAKKILLSAIVSTNSGTAVTVDGGADLSRANFADSTGIGFTLASTNVTAALVDRDFGDITTSSSGTVMTIDNAAVAQVKLGTTGTGTATNFLAGDYSYKQVTTNMIPGLVADIAALQRSLTFTNGVTNVNNVVSADLAAGSNITFSTNNGKITIASTATGGGGSGTNFFLNGVLIQPAYITNSSTLVWATNANGDVYGTVTNVSGTTTDNVVQRIGRAQFYVEGAPNYYVTVSNLTGVVTDIPSFTSGAATPLQVSLTLTNVSSTNYFVIAEVLDDNAPISPQQTSFTITDKSTTNVTAVLHYNNSGTPPGFWVDVWINQLVSVGGSGGDVISTANNNFSGTNNFAGPVNVATLTVNDDAYAAGWDGSTNVPTKNAVYDKIESLSSGSGTKTIAVFRPTDAQPPAANFATLDTRNAVAVLDFDEGATNEETVFVGVIPEAAVLTSGILVRIHWAATSATSGNCRWGVQFEALTTDIDSDSFDTATEAHTATSGTSGVPTITEITATSIDSLAPGGGFRIKVYRDSSDTTNDTMTGDAELIVVELRTAN